MCTPPGNSEFCFGAHIKCIIPPEGNSESLEGKQNSLFPEGVQIKCFVI